MPSAAHEATVDLFRNCPSLLLVLLRDRLPVPLSAIAEPHVEEADFTQRSPIEYRADLVTAFSFGDPLPGVGIILEVQHDRDPVKRFTWPLYTAARHARTRQPTCLVVVTPDRGVAAWAREPITTMQPGSPFVPIVIGPDDIPCITSIEEARRSPELAVLSSHLHAGDERGVHVTHTALRAAEELDPGRAELYIDLILQALPALLRAGWEHAMETGKYEYKSDFAKRYFSQGRAEGEAAGRAQALLAFAAARGLGLSAEQRARILSCTDVPTLERWVARAATASSVADILES